MFIGQTICRVDKNIHNGNVLNMKNINWKETKDRVISSIIVAAATLYFILMFLYSKDIKDKSDLINKNLIIVNEKIDSLKSSQNYIQEKVESVSQLQKVESGVLYDSIFILNKKIEVLNSNLSQTNKLILLLNVQLQEIKRNQKVESGFIIK